MWLLHSPQLALTALRRPELFRQQLDELQQRGRLTALLFRLENQNPAWFVSGSEHGPELADAGMQPADERLIQSFPVHIVIAGDANAEDNCPICLMGYRPGEEQRRLPCLHAFHRACVDAWLMCNCTCPCCRLSIAYLYSSPN